MIEYIPQHLHYMSFDEYRAHKQNLAREEHRMARRKKKAAAATKDSKRVFLVQTNRPDDDYYGDEITVTKGQPKVTTDGPLKETFYSDVLQKDVDHIHEGQSAVTVKTTGRGCRELTTLCSDMVEEVLGFKLEQGDMVEVTFGPVIKAGS